jgi:transposase InsO family protein
MIPSSGIGSSPMRSEPPATTCQTARWRICRKHRWWCSFGKPRSRKGSKPGTAAHELYVCVIKDLFSNCIVGWAIDERMKARIVVAATINSRPRKILDWKTPAEALDEHLRSLQQAGVATTD